MVCELCSSEFTVIPSRAGKAKYCSNRCRLKSLYTNNHRSIEERFWEKVIRGDSDTCWLWTGATGSAGYGVLGLGGRGTGNEYAHRISYRLHYGPIPNNLFVLHSCDNPPCVNPKHLSLGTHLDNMQQSKARGRKHDPYTLTFAQTEVIRASTASPKEIAAQYGISHIHAFRVKTGRVHTKPHWHLRNPTK